MTEPTPLDASFRDPAGFVFKQPDGVFRCISYAGLEDFDTLQNSGLAQRLLDDNLLVPFQVVSRTKHQYILKLETIPFFSYPYEWCPSQLRDAAELTLRIAKLALDHDMILKDASAFNVAWKNGLPIFIDHGSFTRYIPDSPWKAYRQFSMHFLAPLLLMKYRDPRLIDLFQTNLDGIPLELASKLLPMRSWLSPTALLHVHMHASMQRRHENDNSIPQNNITQNADNNKRRPPTLTKRKLMMMLDSLLQTVQSIKASSVTTEWGDYYNNTNYTDKAFDFKKKAVADFCNAISPKTVVDLGANDGTFSRIAAENAHHVIAADMDVNAIETLYRSRTPNIFPLRQDLNNPSPATGVLLQERDSFAQRVHGDAVLALALCHHLRIGSNWPLPKIAQLLSQTAPNALVEFVPKNDSQVQKMLATRDDIYDDWTLDDFIAALWPHYPHCKTIQIPDSNRTLIVASK